MGARRLTSPGAAPSHGRCPYDKSAAMSTPANPRAFVQQILDRQPFSTLIGTRLGEVRPGYAELHLELKPALLQQHGIAHGGAVAALADTALAFAAGSVLGDMVTSEFKINYLQPSLGSALTARAEVIHHSSRQAVCQCRVFFQKDGQEGLCALAQGTIRKAPAPTPQ